MDRIGVYDKATVSDSRWRLSYVNAAYEICENYPEVVAVPAAIDDSIVSEILSRM